MHGIRMFLPWDENLNNHALSYRVALPGQVARRATATATTTGLTYLGKGWDILAVPMLCASLTRCVKQQLEGTCATLPGGKKHTHRQCFLLSLACLSARIAIIAT